MMSTFKERLDKTVELCADDNVTIVEAFTHVINWMRFERAIILRNRYAVLASKLSRRLNTNMDVWEFRKELSKS